MWYERLKSIILSETLDTMMIKSAEQGSALSALALSPHQVIYDYFEKSLLPLKEEDPNIASITEKFENIGEILSAYFSIDDEEIEKFTLGSIQLNLALNEFLIFQNTIQYKETLHANYQTKLNQYHQEFIRLHAQYREVLQQFQEELHQGLVNYTAVKRVISHYLYTLYKLLLIQKTCFEAECRLLTCFMACLPNELKLQKTKKTSEQVIQVREALILQLKERGFLVPNDYFTNPHWINAINKEVQEHVATLKNESSFITELVQLLSVIMKKLQYPIIFQQS